jgi:hypothetical protein
MTANGSRALIRAKHQEWPPYARAGKLEPDEGSRWAGERQEGLHDWLMICIFGSSWRRKPFQRHDPHVHSWRLNQPGSGEVGNCSAAGKDQLRLLIRDRAEWGTGACTFAYGKLVAFWLLRIRPVWALTR